MDRWIPSWRYVPIDYNYELGALENITQKSCFRNNLSGSRVRLRLNNLYNPETMRIAHIRLATRDRESGKLSRQITVTLNGAEEIELPPNTVLYSDELLHKVSARDDFVVTMYFRERTSVRCVCLTWAAYTWHSVHQTGDFTQTEALAFTEKRQLMPGLANDPYPNHYVVGLSEISVLTDGAPKLVALFGDSITHMSYFSDALTAMLYHRYPGRYAVVNGGIGGNRLQKDFPAVPMPGGGHQFGIAGKNRFLTDLYDGAKPDTVFVLEGVNDCSHSIVFGEDAIPAPDDIFDALLSVVNAGRAQSSQIYASTVMPFGAFGAPWREQAETIRCGYNALIRSGIPADDWIDLDALLRDPEDPHRMQEGMHLGDGVHPNWAGGLKMARAVFQKWFSEQEGNV